MLSTPQPIEESHTVASLTTRHAEHSLVCKLEGRHNNREKGKVGVVEEREDE
jgi:hypothetical protein